tara:strand:- start:33 stop:497 length:465 start_codon:yes stop_codon:yes gene_type:complete
MATRALIRVIPRQEGLAYDQAHNHVEKAFFNIYKHWDGYPTGLGVDIAKICNNIIDKNISEFAIDFVSMLEDTSRIELLAISEVDMGQEYIYTIFPKNDTSEVFISIYDVWQDKVVFVGQPDKLIDKYDADHEVEKKEMTGVEFLQLLAERNAE